MTTLNRPSEGMPSQNEIAFALELLRTYAPSLLAFGEQSADVPAESRKTVGLAPWQLNRAKSLIEANLERGICVKALSSACHLSRSHFTYAFRISTGFAPHAWLTARRVERAMALLCEGRLSLSEIALACGFSDHSHFTRRFQRSTGMTPRDWRWHHQTGAPPSLRLAPEHEGPQ